MSTCTQPGCTGTIADGYCDVCGMAAAPGASAAAAVSTGTPTPAAPAAPSAPVADGSPCGQPGCQGTVTDGYCDTCGMAGTSAAPAAFDADAAVSARTSSTQIESAAIGSRRAAGTASTHRTRAGSQRMRAARLGAGLTVVPPAPPVDASKAIHPDPSVPEDKRVCSKCGTEIGRSRDGRPGRSEGFCPQCGQEFSFSPKLQNGDLVGGQYEVAGAIAHGGLGWIYLAKDRNVSDRWVVLKGLLNSGDPDALAAAIAEQQFLAQVEHPLIVEIYNFVTHEGAGYIVMEYVGGKSLKQILKQRMKDNHGAYDPLPVDQALAYLLEVLPAFQYLHDLGLVYCDFKPDNLIQVGDAVKLIDLGGVRRIDDQESAIYGTVGYQAPEVAEVGPSVASDIYTIGRTLVVLCMEFRGYQGTYLHTLPPPESTPLFAEHDSLYWLIAKCCATDPADRFASADELRIQLLGVLREVVAARTRGTALTSAASVLFESPATSASALEWSHLPELRVDTTDAQYSWLSGIGAEDPRQRLEDLEAAPEQTAEVWLARAQAALELDQPAQARGYAADLLAQDPWEWRALWMDGLAALQLQDWDSAAASFNAVYQQVPGELAPKLALALACERGGQGDVAERLYATCAATDATYVAPASFGMARVRAQRQDAQGAVAALDMVPKTSRGYPESRQLRADVLLSGGATDLALLDQAMRSIESVPMDPRTRETYTVRILEQALDVVLRGAPHPDARVGAHPATEPGLRDALERSYRALARDATELRQRVELVNQANAVRMWTLT
ncbi:serine/threonine-protein kinase PknG [Nocardioides sp. cx-169]|uniref:serine/threonine-protein kinase n=1 Tax=Nocardioides sp. cx-169 TaxID=2899080 RepID=UPI001E57C3C7|nr:serine/threonine-protein kinase [Nocardioides sp. cx-169]MCD4536476.1 serine/threonine-protein kinase PknG [Nocardioides sp. cx-169]